MATALPPRHKKPQHPLQALQHPYNGHPLHSFVDADFANSDRKSYTGIVHTFYGSPISWSSNKQKTVDLSSCEAEYLAASSATQQTNWLRRLPTDLHLLPLSTSLAVPTPLDIDNHGAIQVANNAAPTKLRKFIDIRHHHMHDNITKGVITPCHIPTQDNVAEAFTKPLGRLRFQHLMAKLHISAPPSQTSISDTGDC